MSQEEQRVDAVATLHAHVDRETRRLHVLHAARLQCRSGCTSCCVDGLTVFEAEAALLRARHADLLARGVPHAEGACAFLDEAGACRVYVDRPYVCRTQGLPLRWIDDDDVEEHEGAGEEHVLIERRDICPLNEAGEPIEELRAEDCWTLGPVEERLARLQLATGAGGRRVRLRDLFAEAASVRRS